MNPDTTDHILWSFEPITEETWNEDDEADLNYADRRIEKEN